MQKRRIIAVDVGARALEAWRRVFTNHGIPHELTVFAAAEGDDGPPAFEPGTLVLLPAARAAAWQVGPGRTLDLGARYLVLTDQGHPNPLPAVAGAAVAFAPLRPGRSYDPGPALLSLDHQAAVASRLADMESALLRAEFERDRLERQVATLGDRLERARADRGEDARAGADEQTAYALRRVEESIALSRRYDVPLTCLLLELRPSPAVAAGGSDALQAQAAALLKRSVRTTDLVTAYGDRFLVVSPFTAARAGAALSRRLLEQLRRIRGVVQAHAGVANRDDHVIDAPTLLQRVESALERARAQPESSEPD